jgi:Fusaric acid resistance protein-like
MHTLPTSPPPRGFQARARDLRRPGLRGLASHVGRRLRPRAIPILQTASAAVLAWYLADLLLPSERPAFASIAAVISLSATYGRRRRRAAELVTGVVIGLVVGDFIISLIGSGPLQIGLMIMLAMGAALMLGSGELMVNEAAISALLLASIDPGTTGFSPDRFLEALIGGGVALTVGTLFFPPDPGLLAARAAQAVFGRLGWALEQVAAALAAGDPERAQHALTSARDIDGALALLHDELQTARENARFTPPRHGARERLGRYERTEHQLDFAVRNTRVLARHALRYTRSRLPAPEGLPEAVDELAQAVWVLAAQYDEPSRGEEVRSLAIGSAGRAIALFEREPDLALTEILGQVRSTAADLVRASERIGDDPEAAGERPTEELLGPASAVGNPA